MLRARLPWMVFSQLGAITPLPAGVVEGQSKEERPLPGLAQQVDTLLLAGHGRQVSPVEHGTLSHSQVVVSLHTRRLITA